MERLRGQRRKIHLRYINWAQDESLCGKPAEHVVLDSMLHASSAAGLYVPVQTPGKITEVAGVTLNRGPLDLWAWILDLETISRDLPMVVEVKNVRRWLYATATELWELLVKAADVALTIPVLPVLACCWSGPMAWWMAYDVGFFTARMQTQIFSPRIDAGDFDEVADGLAITRHQGQLKTLTDWLSTDLRKHPPSLPSEQIAWYRRQAQRFQVLAPTILDYEALATPLSSGERDYLFDRFRDRVRDVATWPLRGGW